MSQKIQADHAVAYSYQRFSSAEQRKGDSIRRQSQATEAWCNRNRVRLDDRLQFVDEGVSSFRGKHRQSDKFALGYFLSLVQSGRIAAGSFLVVESLDRLSREDVDEALRLLLSLTGAGIRVVQLSPVEVVYERPVDTTRLIIGIMEMARGNSESRMKSERIGAAWEGMRQKARLSGKAITGCCPSWLRRVGDTFELIPDRAAAVRRMFELSADGHGIHGVIRTLKREGYESFGRNGKWVNSSVGHMLTTRTVLGEYQPFKGKKPDGEPVQNYYPAVVDERLYYKVQAGLKSRLRAQKRAADGTPMPKGGRIAHEVNIFAGLMVNAAGGDSIQYHWFTDKRQGKSYGIGRYVNALALTAQANLTSFPVKAFDKGVLSCLTEIDPMDVLPGHDTSADDVMVLSAKLGEIEAQLTKIEEQLATPGEAVDVLVNAAKRLQARRKEVGQRLAEARLKAANPQGEAWGSLHTLSAALDAAEDKEAARLRLRSAVRRVVCKMVCLFVRDGRRQVAVVQFHFVGTDKIRTVFIRHRGELANRKEKTPEHLSWCTLTDELPGKVDLTDPQHLRLVRQVVGRLCLPDHWHRDVEPARLTSEAKMRERKRLYMQQYHQKVRKGRRAAK